MSKVSNIFISSRNRIGGTSSNFSINLQPLITRVRNWSVKQVSLDFSWYLINDSNNTFYYEEVPGVATTITLNNGSPDLTTFCSDLTAKLNAASTVGSTYTCAINSATQQLSITAAGASAADFEILPASMPELSYLLGFLDPVTGDPQVSAAGAVQTGNSVVHLSGPAVVYLASSYLNINSIGNTQTRDFAGDYTFQQTSDFLQIPVNVNFGSVITFTPPAPNVYPFSNDSFSNLNFQLLDERGNELVLNGGHINIHLSCENASQ